MPVKDTKLLPESNVARHHLPINFATAVSQTARPFALFRPGYGFQVADLGLFARTKAGAAGIDARIIRGNGVLNSPALAVSATPEEVAFGAFTAAIGDAVVPVAADATFPFTAAHVVTALLFGVILFQVDAAGTVTTKVPAATPTTPMGFGSAAEAIKALPAADAGNAPMGYLVIEADAGNWVAQTDDLTTDLTSATFTNGPFGNRIGSPFTGTLAAVAGEYAEATLTDDWQDRTGDAEASVVLTQTTDGTGALTDALAVLTIRPFPLNGEPPTYPVVAAVP